MHPGRVVLVLVLALLAPVAVGAPGPPSAPDGVASSAAIFYYAWYGTIARDGGFDHWQQNGHHPPADIASGYYPLRGAYSSSDSSVLDAQMRDIAGAGIGEVVTSWWGRGSPSDARLPAVLAAARAHGLQVAAHLEPYGGRRVSGTGADIAYLRGLGIRDFYVYHATDFPAAAWAVLNAGLSGVRLFAQTPLVGFAKAGGFQGVYTYDVLTWNGESFARVCGQAHAVGLLCAPSVGPGFDARRATGSMEVKPRRDGATYDAMWHAAVRARPDVVTITSYNEWLEGTQIEPASAQGGYESYEGAWAQHGAAASRAYLERTAFWTSRLRRGR